DTEAGAHGFDQNYFVQQVAGLSQLAAEFPRVRPVVIDLGWGTLKSALVKMQDKSFAEPHEAAAHRQTLINEYVAAFRHVEDADLDKARTALKSLAVNISSQIVAEQQGSLHALVDGQLAKLA